VFLWGRMNLSGASSAPEDGELREEFPTWLADPAAERVPVCLANAQRLAVPRQ